LAQNLSSGGDIALVLLGEVPAIGPFFKKKEDAIYALHHLMEKIDRLISTALIHPYQIMFKRQMNRCYTLVIKSREVAVNVLSDIDELLLRRFRKIFRSLFILTCFYGSADKLECLAVTEGLGAVLYSCNDIYGFFQSR